MSNWAERVFELRVKRKVTQRELAKLIGVTSRTVMRWENGDTPRRLHQAIIEALERAE